MPADLAELEELAKYHERFGPQQTSLAIRAAIAELTEHRARADRAAAQGGYCPLCGEPMERVADKRMCRPCDLLMGG